LVVCDLCFPRRSLFNRVKEFKAEGVPLELLQRSAGTMAQVALIAAVLD
jgi:hypothetical protein